MKTRLIRMLAPDTKADKAGKYASADLSRHRYKGVVGMPVLADLQQAMEWFQPPYGIQMQVWVGAVTGCVVREKIGLGQLHRQQLPPPPGECAVSSPNGRGWSRLVFLVISVGGRQTISLINNPHGRKLIPDQFLLAIDVGDKIRKPVQLQGQAGG